MTPLFPLFLLIVVAGAFLAAAGLSALLSWRIGRWPRR